MSRTASAAIAAFALVFAVSCKVSSPGRFETRVATTIKQRIVVGGKKDQNPFAATAPNIHEGQRNFSNYCLVCHGLDGQNTGVPFADRMYPPVPLLTSPEVQSFTDGQLKWIIDNGVGPSGMPASRGVLNDEEIWKIVVYLRHLPPKGSLGEPEVYSGAPPAQQAATDAITAR